MSVGNMQYKFAKIKGAKKICMQIRQFLGQPK